jgi:SAM-dependent methyltransferase
LSSQTIEENPSVIQTVFRTLRKQGPLGTCKRVVNNLQHRLEGIPGSKPLFVSLDRGLYSFQRYLDRHFDKSYGVETVGYIPLKDLTIKSKNVQNSNWYEPISVKPFRQIMSHLSINFGDFEFVDFGSGKGRALFLASDYGFKKIVGVEFAQELHEVALKNVANFERRTGKPSRIENLCMDAVDYQIPESPLVLFFYCPFIRSVMEQVLKNMQSSLAKKPREIILVFHGQLPETIALLKSTGFECREIPLDADWSRFTQYQGFLFFSPGYPKTG